MSLLHAIKKTVLPTRCSAVIVAAGNATRMGGVDKIMADLGGKPLIWHTVKAFEENPGISEIVVVTREDLMVTVAQLCRDSGFAKVRSVLVGGADRAESVQIGAENVAKTSAVIAVHDGARPLVSQRIITETIKLASEKGAAAPAIPVKDTIKLARDSAVESTPPRENLYAIQTPQVFDADLLRAALTNARQKQLSITDDCSAVEAMGMRVLLTRGAERNLKVTTPMDLVVANVWLNREEDT